jgi:chitodextrinase
MAHEYGGVDRVNPLDGGSGAAGSGTAMNSGNVTTTGPNDLLFAGGGALGAMTATGPGYTQRLDTAGNRTMDTIAPSPGTYAATATNGSGAWVLQVAAFKADLGTDTTPPSTPTDLTATAVSNTQVNLSWTASTDDAGVTGYQIERCEGSGCANFTLVTTAAGTTYSDTGRSPATLYRYRVRATDTAGNLSAYSAIAQATTAGVPDTSPPTVPTGLSAQAVSSTQITLSWTASTDNVAVTGYRIYRDGALVDTAVGSPAQDTGLTPGTTYSYSVSAIDAAGNESARTAAVTATTPPPDTTLPAVSLTAPPPGSTVSGTVTISANASDASGIHDVEFLLDGVTINDDTTAPYSYAWDTTTTSNGQHSLTVRAHDNAGNFSNTSGAFVVTVANSSGPPLPVGLEARARQSRTVRKSVR